MPQRSGYWHRGQQAQVSQSGRPHAAGIATLAVERKRSILAVTGGNEGGLCVLDLRDLSRSPLGSVPAIRGQGGGGGAHPVPVKAVDWLPGDDRLFVSCACSRLKVWDVQALSSCVFSEELRAQVNALAVQSEQTASGGSSSAIVAAALEDASITMLDLRMGRTTTSLQGHTASPVSLVWEKPGSCKLYSGGRDGTVRAWDVRMAARSLFLCDPYAFEERREPLKRLGSGAEDEGYGKSTDMRRENSAEEGTIRVEPYTFRGNLKTALGTDRRSTAGMEGTRYRPQSTLEKPAAVARDALLPQQDAAARKRDEQWAQEAVSSLSLMLEPPRRTYVHEASVAHCGSVIDVAVSGEAMDGKRKAGRRWLLSRGTDNKVRVWDSSTGAPLGAQVISLTSSVLEDSGRVAAVAAPEDACFVADGCNVSVFCLRSARMLTTLTEHSAAVRGVQVLDGGSQVVTASDDGRLLCWAIGSSTDRSAHTLDLESRPDTASSRSARTFSNLTAKPEVGESEVICLDD